MPAQTWDTSLKYPHHILRTLLRLEFFQHWLEIKGDLSETLMEYLSNGKYSTGLEHLDTVELLKESAP